MTRGQLVVLLVFLGIVGVGAAVLGPRLVGRSPPTPVRVEERTRDRPSVPEPPPPAPREADVVALAVVGPDGAIPADRLRLSGATLVEGGDSGTVRVTRTRGPAWVGADGLAWARLPPRAASGEAVRVALVRAAPPLEILVREPDGSPSAGAAVLPGAWGPEDGPIRAGPDGVARLEGRPPGVATIRVGGAERDGPVVRVLLGATTRVEATLRPARVVLGKVRGPDGSPVVGASVRGLSSEGAAGSETGTDGGGAFRWTGPLSSSLVLLVRAPGFAETAVEPPWPDPRAGLSSTVDVALEPASPAIEGRVQLRSPLTTSDVRLSAEPAVSAVLRELYGPEAVVAPSRRLDLLSGGRFSLDGLASGVPWRVSVRGAVLPEDYVVSPGPKARALDLEPTPAPDEPAPPAGPAFLEGQVTDVLRRPLPGITVFAEGRTATTGSDGRFRLEGLDAGARRVDVDYGFADAASPGEADPTAFVAVSRASVRVGDSAVSLVLPRAAGASFRIVDGLDDRALSWAHVVLLDGDGQVRFDAAVSTDAGRVRLDGLEPGTAGTLSVFAPGLRRQGSVTLEPGVVSDLGDLRLSRGGRVSGEVRGRDGKPLRAVVCEVEDGWVKGARDLLRERDRAYRRVETVEDGSFVLEGLDASRPVALAVWAPGLAPVPRRILWPSGPDAPMKATLLGGARLRLRIVDPKGVPVAGAVVDLEEAHTGIHLLDLWRRGMFGGVAGSTPELRLASETLLFEDPARPGAYRVGPVEPGPYEIWVERPGYRPLRKRLTVPDDAPEGAGAPLSRVSVADLEIHLQLDPE